MNNHLEQRHPEKQYLQRKNPFSEKGKRNEKYSIKISKDSNITANAIKDKSSEMVPEFNENIPFVPVKELEEGQRNRKYSLKSIKNNIIDNALKEKSCVEKAVENSDDETESQIENSCIHCNKEFDSVLELKNHNELLNANRCDQCCFRSCKSENLENHKIIEHGQGKIDKNESVKLSEKKNTRISDARTYQCDQCSFKSSTPPGLKIHKAYKQYEL